MEKLKALKFGVAVVAMACMVSFGVVAQTSSNNSDQSASKSASSANSSGQLSAADKNFVMKAAQGGMAEVELGQLAAQKGNSDDVKKFGQRMVDDHSKANDQLKSIAQQKGVQIPSDLDAKDKALKDKLSNMSGDQFDHMYMQHMVQDHKKDVAEFKKEANSGKDQDVKNFAQQTVPTLEDHLKMAQQTYRSEMNEGKKGATTASNQQQ
jgi:putative membrane protein